MKKERCGYYEKERNEKKRYGLRDLKHNYTWKENKGNQ